VSRSFGVVNWQPQVEPSSPTHLHVRSWSSSFGDFPTFESASRESCGDAVADLFAVYGAGKIFAGREEIVGVFCIG